MKRIGLVLGAGGLTGQAFHAGVLAGLAEGVGWEADSATLIVGTSAGAGVGTYLRSGLSGTDYAAMLAREPMSAAGSELVSRLGPSGDWSTPTLPRSWPKPLHPKVVARLLTEPHRVRPEALLGISFPAGRIDTETWAASLRGLTGATWPSGRLWICAVRTDDARRVAFGRAGAPRTDVATAVAASSAIPGYFAPVEIDGHRYIDGGVHSPTNADILRDEELDLVVVCSPMSTSSNARFRSVSYAARLHFRRRLTQEMRKLRNAGIPVVAFQPSSDDQAAMGMQAMDPARNAAVIRQAKATTLRRLAEGRHAHHLALLAA